MKINRFMEIKENGNIAFIKVVQDESGLEVTCISEYDKRTQTALDFAQEAQERFDNENPDWAGILEWQMVGEEDLLEWLKDPENVTI